MASPTNPLLDWLATSGVNQPSPNDQGPILGPPQPGTQTPQQGLPGWEYITGGPWGNPLGVNHPTRQSSITANLGAENIITAQMKNLLAPMFANMMMGYAQPAGKVFGQFANLGSPFYQQKQRQSWEQGVGQANAATGQAREQIASKGYGYAPSGLEAGMLGGAATGESGNLATNFLQNLFQNEQLQLQGAQGLSGLAGMFQPQGLMGGTSTPFGQSQASQFGDMAKGISDLLNAWWGNSGGGAAEIATAITGG